jgi:hypothetical protein
MYVMNFFSFESSPSIAQELSLPQPNGTQIKFIDEHTTMMFK